MPYCLVKRQTCVNNLPKSSNMIWSGWTSISNHIVKIQHRKHHILGIQIFLKSTIHISMRWNTPNKEFNYEATIKICKKIHINTKTTTQNCTFFNKQKLLYKTTNYIIQQCFIIVQTVDIDSCTADLKHTTFPEELISRRRKNEVQWVIPWLVSGTVTTFCKIMLRITSCNQLTEVLVKKWPLHSLEYL